MRRCIPILALLLLSACAQDDPVNPYATQLAKVPRPPKYAVVRVQHPSFTWAQAERLAKRYVNRALGIAGGHLVVITSAEEQAQVFNMGGGGCWIGLRQTDKTDEPLGSWQWVDGKDLVHGESGWLPYANWMAGEPNDWWGYNGGEDVAVMENDGTWNDMPADYLYNCYIVEDNN